MMYTHARTRARTHAHTNTAPEKPVLHRQSLEEVLEAAESESAGQLTHASADVAVDVVE